LKICPACYRVNPDEVDECLYCGNDDWGETEPPSYDSKIPYLEKVALVPTWLQEFEKEAGYHHPYKKKPKK